MSDVTMRTNESLLLLDQTFADCAQVIDALAGLAKVQGLVEDPFLEKIQQREIEYPTGLAMPIPLAIPHISDGCLQPFVSIATLKTPVIFKSMDHSGDDVPAQIVFLFGIINPQDQLPVLRKFAKSFSKKEAVEKLLAAHTSAAFLAELNEMLEGLLNIDETNS